MATTSTDYLRISKPSKNALRIEFEIQAPVELLFAQLSPLDAIPNMFAAKCVQTQPGKAYSEGEGAVRRIYLIPGVFYIEEEIVCFEPAKQIDYVVTKGLAVQQHQASMQFSAVSENHSKLDYTIELKMWPVIQAITHTVLSMGLRRGLQAIKDKLENNN